MNTQATVAPVMDLLLKMDIIVDVRRSRFIQHPLESRSNHIINGALVDIGSVGESVCVVTIGVTVSLEDEFESPGS